MLRKLLVLLVATVASIALVQPAAHADTTITKVGTPSTKPDPTSSQPFVFSNARGCPGTARGMAYVVYNGDYIVVRDQCKDGRGIMAVVNWKKDGEAQFRRCQNLSGVGSKVECDFDWPETGVYPKSLVLYVRAATGSDWEFAMVRHWGDQG